MLDQMSSPCSVPQTSSPPARQAADALLASNPAASNPAASNPASDLSEPATNRITREDRAATQPSTEIESALRQKLAALLHRASAASPTPPPLQLLGPMALARGRLHQATGPARRTLAALVAGAAQAEGPVLWLTPAWLRERLCPQGLLPFADPGKLILASCPHGSDVLWAAEEALRSGAVAAVIAECAEVPDLRQVRRLHRAAAEGLARAQGAGHARAPLALALLVDAGETPIVGVESRWRLAPLPPPAAGSSPRASCAGHAALLPQEMLHTSPSAWRLDRLRMASEPPAAWLLVAEAASIIAKDPLPAD